MTLEACRVGARVGARGGARPHKTQAEERKVTGSDRQVVSIRGRTSARSSREKALGNLPCGMRWPAPDALPARAASSVDLRETTDRPSS